MSVSPDAPIILVDFTSGRLSKRLYYFVFGIVLLFFALSWCAQQLADVTGYAWLQILADTVWNNCLLDQQALHGQPWRFVTHAFLHAGYVHLFFNMMVFADLYRNVRSEFLRHSWLVIFFVAVVAGGVLQLSMVDSGIKLVGASGGVCGLFGAALASCWRYRSFPKTERPWERPLPLRTFIIVLVVQIGIELSPAGVGVGHYAHLGGLLSGLALGFALPIRLQPRLLASREGAFHCLAYTTQQTKSEINYMSVSFMPTEQYVAGQDWLACENEYADWRGRRSVKLLTLYGGPVLVDSEQVVELVSTYSIHDSLKEEKPASD